MAVEKELANSEFPLGILIMKKHQYEDEQIYKLTKRLDTDQYTNKEVEGIFLLEENN